MSLVSSILSALVGLIAGRGEGAGNLHRKPSGQDNGVSDELPTRVKLPFTLAVLAPTATVVGAAVLGVFIAQDVERRDDDTARDGPGNAARAGTSRADTSTQCRSPARKASKASRVRRENRRRYPAHPDQQADKDLRNAGPGRRRMVATAVRARPVPRGKREAKARPGSQAATATTASSPGPAGVQGEPGQPGAQGIPQANKGSPDPKVHRRRASSAPKASRPTNSSSTAPAVR